MMMRLGFLVTSHMGIRGNAVSGGMSVRLENYWEFDLKLLSYNHRSCEMLKIRVFDANVYTLRHAIYQESCTLGLF